MNESSRSLRRAHASQHPDAKTRSGIAVAGLFLARPLVVMAARVLGPGPTRLRLVKLAHNLAPGGAVVELSRAAHGEDQRAAVQPTSRAA